MLGVGRLLAISSSVAGLVLRACAALRETGSWLPPPETQLSGAEISNRLPNSSLDFPNPFSAIGFVKVAINSFLKLGNSMRSYGRLGPATLATTLVKSRSKSAE